MMTECPHNRSGTVERPVCFADGGTADRPALKVCVYAGIEGDCV